MAILKQLKVLVTVDGQSLKEFVEHGGDEADSADKIIRYIEAVSGAEFQVLFDALDHTSALCGGVTLCEGLTVDVYVDGRGVEYLLLRRESGLQCTVGGMVIRESGVWKKMPFLFSEIQTSRPHQVRPSFDSY